MYPKQSIPCIIYTLCLLSPESQSFTYYKLAYVRNTSEVITALKNKYMYLFSHSFAINKIVHMQINTRLGT